MDREPTESAKKELLFLPPTIAVPQEGNYMGEKITYLSNWGYWEREVPLETRHCTVISKKWDAGDNGSYLLG